MSSETINAGQGTIIAVGNGNNTVNVIGGSNDTISIGSGTNNLTVTGGTGDTITAGNGNDTITVTGGSNNIITVGSGNDTLVASGDHNDSINLGMGNDTVYLGADDTVHMGKGSELLVLPPSTPVLAAAPITVTEDQTISLASLGISASLSQFGFGFENIYGFAAADQLEFTTAQFANFQAVMAAATQVGQNTVITDTAVRYDHARKRGEIDACCQEFCLRERRLLVGEPAGHDERAAKRSQQLQRRHLQREYRYLDRHRGAVQRTDLQRRRGDDGATHVDRYRYLHRLFNLTKYCPRHYSSDHQHRA